MAPQEVPSHHANVLSSSAATGKKFSLSVYSIHHPNDTPLLVSTAITPSDSLLFGHGTSAAIAMPSQKSSATSAKTAVSMTGAAFEFGISGSHGGASASKPFFDFKSTPATGSTLPISETASAAGSGGASALKPFVFNFNTTASSKTFDFKSLLQVDPAIMARLTDPTSAASTPANTDVGAMQPSKQAAVPPPAETGTTSPTTSKDPQQMDPAIMARLQELPKIVAGVMGADEKTQFEAMTQFRKLLSIERNPPIQAVIDTGVVPCFVQFIEHDHNPPLQVRCASLVCLI